MNENAYRLRGERGEVQIGTWVTMIRTPSVLTLLQAAGLDFARVDMPEFEDVRQSSARIASKIAGPIAPTGQMRSYTLGAEYGVK